MDEQNLNPSASIPPETEAGKPKLWAWISIALILLIAGYFVYRWWSSGVLRPAAPEETGLPTIAPVLEPELASYDDIAQFTEGKPLPEPLDPEEQVLPQFEGNEHIYGGDTAQVTMVEYASISHPYTKLLHPKIREFVEANAGKVNWVFRNYPSTKNEEDYVFSQAAECIALQIGNDAYWKYMETVFSGKITKENMIAAAGEVGADPEAVRACVDEERTFDYVLLDKQNAQLMLKLYVSPAFVFQSNVTGEMRIAEGANTVEYLQGVLDEMTKS